MRVLSLAAGSRRTLSLISMPKESWSGKVVASCTSRPPKPQPTSAISTLGSALATSVAGGKCAG